MGKYIKLNSLWECETCDPFRGNKFACDECAQRRKYFPAYSKLKILDGEIVPIAEWVYSDGHYPYCSNCHYETENEKTTRHCPECGAKMI